MKILDAAGLALLSLAGFLLATSLGCAIAGGALLVVSRGIAKGDR